MPVTPTSLANQATSLNVKSRFGAVGNGTAQDHQAFQSALDYAANYGIGEIYIPDGTYRINSVLTQTKPVRWVGQSKSGTKIFFDHTGGSCISIEGAANQTFTQFKDLTLYGNSVANQHAIKIPTDGHIGNFTRGGIEDCHFYNFGGCLVYYGICTSNGPYDENVIWKNVSCKNVGGAIGGDTATPGVGTQQALSITQFTVINFALGDTVDVTSSPQHAFFDLRYIRQVHMEQVVLQGVAAGTTLFRFGGDSANTIDGIHIEFTTVSPDYNFEFVTPGFGNKQNGETRISPYVLQADSKFVKFTDVEGCHVILQSSDSFNYDLNSKLVDWGTGVCNFITLDGVTVGSAGFTVNDDHIDRIRVNNLRNMLGGAGTFGSRMTMRDDEVLRIDGGWMLGAENGQGICYFDTSSSVVSDFGMVTDSIEGRVFEIVSDPDTVAGARLQIDAGPYMIGKFIVCAIRYYYETAVSGFVFDVFNNTLDQGFRIGNSTINAWQTAFLAGRITSSSLHNPVSIGMRPSGPAASGTSKLRIAAIYVGMGTSAPFMAGGGYPLAPIQWFASAAPTYGTYVVGDKVWNTAPAAGGTPGWVCTTAGSPGTWKAMASLAA